MSVALDNERTFTTVGALCEKYGGDIQTGPFGSQLHAEEYSEVGIPVVMPQDMVKGNIVCDRIARVPPEVAARMEKHHLRAGDVVFSRRGDVARFSIVSKEQEGWICGTGCIRIRLNSPGIDPGYLRHYLAWGEVGAWLKENAKGVTMPNLNTEIIRALAVSLVSLPRQQRIAAILDQAESLRAKRRAALKLMDKLAHAIFAEFAGKGFGWPELPVSELCEVKGGKRLPKGEPYAELETPYRYIRVSDMTDYGLCLDSVKFLDEKVASEISRYTVAANDVLISIAGTIGLVALVPEILDGANLTENAARLTSIDSAVCDPEFLSVALRSDRVSEQIQAVVGQATIGKLALFKIEELRIPMPPLSVQKNFVGQLRDINRRRQSYELSMAKLDALFASLQHRAFRGEL